MKCPVQLWIVKFWIALESKTDKDLEKGVKDMPLIIMTLGREQQKVSVGIRYKEIEKERKGERHCHRTQASMI